MMHSKKKIEIWGGLECTINRVKDNYFDQLEYAGHYNRDSDIELISALGIKMLRYPVLWERHQPQPGGVIDWTCTDKKLEQIRSSGIKPIVGLVHHGSGPKHVNFFDGSFENGLAAYAGTVAEKYPWVEYYTPVNEPLTTARFCGLYGHWYPHLKSDYSFYKILLSECKATILAMQAIRMINPDAKLIQTDDLGKCYSTPLLKYQADFENERRWISYELICGTLTPDKVMWKRLVKAGIPEKELYYFLYNNCKPYIAGFNYYITSERYLDENLSKYDSQYHGGNGKHAYADIEIVKVPLKEKHGAYTLIMEAWKRLNLPVAITECHLFSTREEQMRWFYQMWQTAARLKSEGVDIRAVTAWAMLGLHGWNRLVTQPWGNYEPGMFNLNTGRPRPTALAAMIKALTTDQTYYHPVLETEGWWERDIRLLRAYREGLTVQKERLKPDCQPVLILGNSGSLAKAISEICDERNIHYLIDERNNPDFTHLEFVEQIIKDLNPWAVIYAEEHVKINEVKQGSDDNLAIIAACCKKYNIRLMAFTSALSYFPEPAEQPFVSEDTIDSPGRIQLALATNSEALIIHTPYLLDAGEPKGFIANALDSFKNNQVVDAADDVFIHIAYVPDLLHESLNMLLDGETGIFCLTSSGRLSWADLAYKIAVAGGFDTGLVNAKPMRNLLSKVSFPFDRRSAEETEIKLPAFESVLEVFFQSDYQVSYPVENDA